MSKKQIPEKMLSIINGHTTAMTWVGGVGGIAGAGADADKAGHHLDSQTAKKVTMAVATGIGTFAVGMKGASMALGWLGAVFTGGLTLVASVAANVALNRTLTNQYGQAAAIYFLETKEISSAKAAAKVIYQIFRAKSGFTYAFNH